MSYHTNPNAEPETALSLLPDLESPVPPSLLASFLLVARQRALALGLPQPDARAVLTAAGSNKSQAYALMSRVAAALIALARGPGRPVREKPTCAAPSTATLTRGVLRYLMEHPGAVSGSPTRQVYSDGFRLRILELREQLTELELDDFADAVCVPRGTIEDWLRLDAPGAAPDTAERPAVDEDSTLVEIETVTAEWRRWSGPFTAFCEHLRHHRRLSLGNALIARILHTHGERPQQRRGHARDAESTRGTFETFFPNAQWVGDGMAVKVTINDVEFTFNVELDIDADSGAVLGASIRNEEDARAVVEAFRNGVGAAGAPPIALLLDNRPSNHVEEVDAALGDTLRMRATLSRPENKAHVEGCFGLFAQHAPPLHVSAMTPRELARELLRLRLQTFARALNHRPRRDRNWKTRVELFRGAAPTEEQIRAAKASLRERIERMNRARASQLAAADQPLLAIIDDAFARLCLRDPEHHFRAAFVRYGRDVVLESIAIFEGKKARGSLPSEVDARYLLGIANNLHHAHEAHEITRALLERRLDLRDRLLSGLQHARHEITARLTSAAAASKEFLARALSSDRAIDRLFWFASVAEQVRRELLSEQRSLFITLARRIHAAFDLARDDRARYERELARMIWPVT